MNNIDRPLFKRTLFISISVGLIAIPALFFFFYDDLVLQSLSISLVLTILVYYPIRFKRIDKICTNSGVFLSKVYTEIPKKSWDKYNRKILWPVDLYDHFPEYWAFRSLCWPSKIQKEYVKNIDIPMSLKKEIRSEKLSVAYLPLALLGSALAVFIILEIIF